MKRQASFGAPRSTSTSQSKQQEHSMKEHEESNGYKVNGEDREEDVVSFRTRPGQGQHYDSQRERGQSQRGYGDDDDGKDKDDDRVHFRKRGGEYEKHQQQAPDLSVTGLVSQSARERERAERERRSYRD